MNGVRYVHMKVIYMVGLGMVTPYALGLALALPNHKVIAIDGDSGTLFDLSVYGYGQVCTRQFVCNYTR